MVTFPIYQFSNILSYKSKKKFGETPFSAPLKWKPSNPESISLIKEDDFWWKPLNLKLSAFSLVVWATNAMQRGA